jgi:hypothetical protein
MPLAGGASDKLGNSYELSWTAYCMQTFLLETRIRYVLSHLETKVKELSSGY